jgi:hypothetical protein
MRRAAFFLLLAVVFPAGVCLAHDHHGHAGRMLGCEVEPPMTWASRHDIGRARYAMPTRDGSVTLLLTRGEVVVQLSDRTMRKIDRELDEERDEDEGALADAIKGAVLGGVRSLLDHSLEYPLDELRDVRYREGRLELITEDGDRVFEDIRIDDRDLLESFRPQDARAFVEEFRALKGRER